MNFRFNFLCAIIGAALAGCGVPNAAGPVPNAADPVSNAASVSSNFSKVRHRDARLFISDYEAQQIYIYTVPAFRLIKTISNVGQPQGECSDNRGDVWVTSNFQIFEFDHAGSLVRTQNDPFGFPGVGCEWDPTTGNLAVTNINVYCCSGTVLIYPGGSGTPSQFGVADGRLYYYVGYHSRGNLFFDAEDLNYAFLLGELPKGGKARDIDVSGGPIGWEGMVQSGGPSTLYVGDITCKS
jgi:hypothetical protein